jgi:hypothetical protein
MLRIAVSTKVPFLVFCAFLELEVFSNFSDFVDLVLLAAKL